jgi:hypothetical protein
MKIKDGFILRKIANSDMVIPIGKNIAYFNGVISLNETAAFLWRKLKDGIELDNLVDELTTEYEISRDLAQTDVEQFISELTQANILEQYA